MEAVLIGIGSMWNVNFGQLISQEYGSHYHARMV